MTQTIIQKLSSYYAIHLQSSQLLKNGLTLINIALKVLYQGNNTFLSTKLAQSQNKNNSITPSANTNKVGNNVILINNLLRHIKSDTTLPKEAWIQQLVFYDLIQNQQILCKFINWMIQFDQNRTTKVKENNQKQQQIEQQKENARKDNEQQQQKQTLPLKLKKPITSNIYQNMTEEQINSMSSNRFRNIQQNDPIRFKTQECESQNDFDNLFFASNLKKGKPTQEEQRIIISPQKGDKIVRKGSFKLLKPKVTFNNDDQSHSQPKQLPQFSNKVKNNNSQTKKSFSEDQQKLSNFYEPDELKQISMIQPSNQHQNQINGQHIGHHENFYHESSSFQIYDTLQEAPSKKNITQTPLLSNKDAQNQNRKTIPKNLSKPPLHRSSSRKNKQNYLNEPNGNDKEKTVQQSIKKKNFFNFSQPQDLVSNFNYQLEVNEQNRSSMREPEENKDLQQNYQTSSRSKIFEKIMDLHNDQKSYSLKEYKSGENQAFRRYDRVTINEEENSIPAGKTLYQNEVNQQIYQHHKNQYKKTFQDPHESSSNLLKLKNHFLQKELYILEKQISKEQSSLHQIDEHQESQQKIKKEVHQHQSGHKKSISGHKNSTSFESAKNSNRKISKIHLIQLSEKDKLIVIDWLDSLHFIDKNKLNSEKEGQNEIFEKFKDGTRFVELCNHYIGRGKPLPHFSNPKKNAQIHSNYSKVFEYLKSYSQWDYPQLLFAYELFVPYPQELSIWSLLYGMHKLLTKKGKAMTSNDKSASKQQKLIYTKNIESSRKKSVQKQFEQLEFERNRQKQLSEELPAPKTLNFNSSNYKQNPQSLKKHQSASLSSRSHSNFTKPIEFVRQIPQNLKHSDLVQQDQQHESCTSSERYARQNQVNMNVYFEGYKDKYMRKTIQNSLSKEKSKCASLETPKKIATKNEPNLNEQSFIYPFSQSIINKGTIRKSSSKKILQNQLKKLQNSSCKLLSTKKSQRQSQKSKIYPKISLNMQMKVEKILKYFGLHRLIDQKNSQKLVKFQLLQDPIRNGSLVNMLLGKFVPSFQGKHIKTIKSIEHCRQNYLNFYAMIKNKYGQEGFEMVEKYLDFTEDILKGQKVLFYGIAYSLTQLMENKGFKMSEENSYKTKSQAQEAVNTYRVQKQRAQSMIELFKYNHIEWIRYIERSNPKVTSYRIRTQQDLRKCLYSGLLLYAFTENSSIKPIYQNPCNNEEKEGNLKKIICYLVQNKIALDKEDFYNVKGIVQYKKQVINGIIQKLVKYSVQKYGVSGYQQISYMHNGTVFGQSYDENKGINSNRIVAVSKDTDGSKPIALGKYLKEHQNNQNYEQKHVGTRLETTTAELINQTHYQPQINNNKQYNSKHDNDDNHNNNKKLHQDSQLSSVDVQIPWMRKLGFTNCSLAINNGIVLCRLISKLTRTNIKYNQNISNDAKIPKPESLGYIRKAIKLIPGFKYDQIDIYEADEATTLKVYEIIKEKFRNTYELTKILSNHNNSNK